MDKKVEYNPLNFVMFFIIAPFLLFTNAYGEQVSSIHASVTVKVGNKDYSSSVLIKKAEDSKGYFTAISEERISFKIPYKKHKKFIREAESTGTVINRSYSATDHTFELNRKKSLLTAKEDILKQYMVVLRSSEKKNIFYVEKEVTKLIEEIEKLKGSINKIEHISKYALISVYFKFRDRSAPIAKKASSFSWINSMNMVKLIEDFKYAK